MGHWEQTVTLALQEFAALKSTEKQLLGALRHAERSLDFRLRFKARERWFLAREQAHAKNSEIVGMIQERMAADKVRRVG